ncbi:MAG: hypothetical protein KME42_25040 [Tildeniella nuda ZEHNDER 1965/U140]|nr:hypothetical protein [Tildeniella nuda ZEHNDER 1965/U140]
MLEYQRAGGSALDVELLLLRHTYAVYPNPAVAAAKHGISVEGGRIVFWFAPMAL